MEDENDRGMRADLFGEFAVKIALGAGALKGEVSFRRLRKSLPIQKVSREMRLYLPSGGQMQTGGRGAEGKAKRDKERLQCRGVFQGELMIRSFRNPPPCLGTCASVLDQRGAEPVLWRTQA